MVHPERYNFILTSIHRRKRFSLKKCARGPKLSNLTMSEVFERILTMCADALKVNAVESGEVFFKMDDSFLHVIFPSGTTVNISTYEK